MSLGCPTILLEGSKDLFVTALPYSPLLGRVSALLNQPLEDGLGAPFL